MIISNTAAYGGASVALSAIRMHMDYQLKYLAGTIANSPRGVFSVWLRGSGGSHAHPTTANNTNQNNHYIFGQHTPGATDAEHDPGFNFSCDNSAGSAGGGTGRLNLSPPADTTHPMNGANGPPFITNATFCHHLLIWDTNFAAGSKRMAYAQNGTPTNTTLNGDTNGASNVGYNGADFWLNNAATGNTPSIFDVAQAFFDTPADVSGLITGNGVFAAGAIAKFYNNGPVDFGATGSGPLGTQPLIYHNGDKTAFGTNNGSLGAPTAVGTSQRRNPYDYMFGPGATIDRPYESWTVWDNTGWPAESTGGPYTNILNYGEPLAVGDLMILFIRMSNNAASSGSSRNIVVNGTGWTKQQDIFLSGTTGGDFAIWYKIADINDVTAAGNDWTNAPTITWTTRATAFAAASYTLSVYKNVTAISASAISQVTGSVASGYPCPSVTAPAGKSLLLTGIAPWEVSNAFEGEPGPPPGENLLWFPQIGSSAGSETLLSWEAINAAGATGTKTWTATVTGNTTAAFQVIMQ